MSTHSQFRIDRSSFKIYDAMHAADIYRTCLNDDREFIRDQYTTTYKSDFSIFLFFDLATTKISGESYITLSLIIPLIRGIESKLAEVESEIITESGKKI